jgi:hypothetical protein
MKVSEQGYGRKSMHYVEEIEVLIWRKNGGKKNFEI